MRDLYKQLGVGEASGDADIRAALAGAAPEVREAAELILLDPKRRAVYDRNRRVLVTIGRLRGHLGLNLTRFWPRPRFADFTINLSPVATEGPGRPIDAATMAWALGVDVGGGGVWRRRRTRRALLIGAALVLLGLLAVAVCTGGGGCRAVTVSAFREMQTAASQFGRTTCHRRPRASPPVARPDRSAPRSLTCRRP